jgi:hypothetical protein
LLPPPEFHEELELDDPLPLLFMKDPLPPLPWFHGELLPPPDEFELLLLPLLVLPLPSMMAC